ncbi:AAA family ATPase [[Haemophilus] ducreyi]|uniref:AAA family ATPase n=1 Tax=Haemophilus ducreyi TaxID=730 RepID=UPI000654CAEE|nr:AAA family ATPase [[Haemophilus] ducreyi]AKO47574.1 protease [[Haemophilus] ducreyi]AKO48956.1 protease [[Haemophilus] ducreyi]
MILTPIAHQLLTLQHTFKPTNAKVNFFDFQTNAKQAIDLFKQAQFGSLLVIKTETFPEFIESITGYVAKDLTSPLIVRTEFNRNHLFGYSLYLDKQQRLENVEGAIQQAEQGILVLNVKALLLDITQWDKLKQALLFGCYEPHAMNHIPSLLANIEAHFKLILVGNREDIALLAEYDESLYQFAHYTEIESYFSFNAENRQMWGDYVQTMAEKWCQRSFSMQALTQFLQAYIRESEDQSRISISPTLLKKHLLGLTNFYANQAAFAQVASYFSYLEQQSAVLNKYTLQDMLTNQLYIDTADEFIGQINALSVIEFDGIPYAFGEPLRISCNVQYGDGEIMDIERKVELGGNIHSKGIIIAQSCLANLLAFPTQLPFSASLAFEQSYGEVDGDSSSLAILCVLISALAKLPLPQSIAVTGSIDQFGNVLSVGGVNQKIEGFFNLCKARQLTGKQGVIIPATCLSHLSLISDVINAIKAKQFHIWSVKNIFEAVWILLEHHFYDEDQTTASDKPTIFNLIHQQLEQEQENSASGSFFAKIYQLFTKN